jgi:hypothetical protein
MSCHINCQGHVDKLTLMEASIVMCKSIVSLLLEQNGMLQDEGCEFYTQ